MCEDETIGRRYSRYLRTKKSHNRRIGERICQSWTHVDAGIGKSIPKYDGHARGVRRILPSRDSGMNDAGYFAMKKTPGTFLLAVWDLTESFEGGENEVPAADPARKDNHPRRPALLGKGTAFTQGSDRLERRDRGDAKSSDGGHWGRFSADSVLCSAG